MKTVKDLMETVKGTLETKGFKMTCSYDHMGMAVKEDKFENKLVEGYSNLTHSFGFSINFETVHRHNGTDENQSVDVMIYQWERSSGRRIAKERIKTKMSDKSIMNRIDKIVEMYETL